MSGIIGIVNLDGAPMDRLLLARLTGYLAFRGPDAQETWSQGPVALGHTLLRTVDDTRPDGQPLTLDGQVWIVADARVDGRGELRQKLRGHGCRDLKEATDAELILQSYLVWGEDCVRHLIGDFAFAIWDEPRRRLFGARDHFGVKPFFYARVGNCLVFSNTLNCLRLHPDVSDELNDLAIGDFLLFDYNQDPATTTFADINRVPPAHYLTLQDGALQVRRYWTLPQEGPLRYPRQQDYVDHFKELLTQAVADRLRTPRVGIFLSGGLDSSNVAAVARHLRAGTNGIRAYNSSYDWLIPDSEGHYSQVVANHLKIPISKFKEDGYQLFERRNEIEIYQPEPKHAPRVAGSIDELRKVSRDTRVILTGEGGDILLVPSQSYVHKSVRSMQWGRLAVEFGRCILLHRRLPPVGYSNLLKRLKSDIFAYYPPWLNPEFAARLNLPARYRHFRPEPLPAHPLRPEVCRGLSARILQFWFERIYDAGSTGVPVESRHPLFDVRLINYALALPPLPWCVSKIMLREAGRGLLPETILNRPKEPLSVDPDVELLKKPESKWIDDFTPAPGLERYVRRAAIPRIHEEQDEIKLLDNLRPLSLNYWLTGYRKARPADLHTKNRDHEEAV
jgi:asparagine synthase (glutamine-hydrolysing)